MYNREKCKIYFSVNGLGFGHASRSNKLIKEALDHGNIVFISTYGEGAKYFKKIYKNVFCDKELKYYFDDKGRLSFKVTFAKEFIRAQAILLLHVFTELRNLLNIKPQVVISDSRISTIIASFLVKSKRFVIINQLFIEIPRIKPMNSFISFIKKVSERIIYELTYYWWNKSKLILVPDLPPPYTFSYNNIKIKSKEDINKVLFIGPLFDFFEYTKDGNILPNTNLVTVVISGTEYEKLAFLRHFLKLINGKKFGKYFLIFTGLEKIDKIVGSNFTILGFSEKEELKRAMLSSKFLILTGGHTSLFEGIFYEKPFLVLLLKGHTEKINNAKALSKLGCCEYEFIEDISEDKLNFLINKMFVNEKYYLINIKLLKNKLNEKLNTFKIENILNEN